MLAGETTLPLSRRDDEPAFQEAAAANGSLAAQEDKPAPRARAVSESLSPTPPAVPRKAEEPTPPGASKTGQIPPSSSAAPAIRLQLVETSAFSERLKNVLGGWRKGIGRLRPLLLGAVLALALGSGYLLVAPRFHGPAETLSRLDLQVENEKSLLFLSWNRNVPPIAAGNSGILSIKDGTFQQRVNLDTAQLHGGAFEYAPRSEDVTFRLAVRAPAGEIGEWVRVVMKDRPASPAGRTVVKAHSRGWMGPGSSADTQSLFDVLPAQPASAPVRKSK